MGCLKATFTHTVPCVQEHWFSLRKIHGQWWNFNSLYPAPQQLSQFYLLAYLATLREQGYSIFVVHGNLPTYPDTSVTSDQGTWYTEAQVLGPLLRIATCKQFWSRFFCSLPRAMSHACEDDDTSSFSAWQPRGFTQTKCDQRSGHLVDRSTVACCFHATMQLSQFYLSAYLSTLRKQGCSICVVHRSLPTYSDSTVTSD